MRKLLTVGPDFADKFSAIIYAATAGRSFRNVKTSVVDLQLHGFMSSSVEVCKSDGAEGNVVISERVGEMEAEYGVKRE